MLDFNKTEPIFFTTFKEKNKAIKYTDCSDEDFKKNLRNEILKEQNYQCFYCEKKISNDIDTVHIDHIKQRGAFHHLECSYGNMILSCNGNNGKHCGKYKDTKGSWDDKKYIKLVNDNPEIPSNFFKYMSNGKIIPKNNLSDKDKERVKATIVYLNLTHKDLVDARKVVIMQISIYEKQQMNKKDMYRQFREFESLFK